MSDVSSLNNSSELNRQNASDDADCSRTVSGSGRSTLLMSRLEMKSPSAAFAGSDVVVGLQCEDCSICSVIRTWRWCRSCERVLCETCAVERHLNLGEAIETYATAVRREGEEFRKRVVAAEMTLNILREKAAIVQQLQDQIRKRIDNVTHGACNILPEDDSERGKFHQTFDAMHFVAARPLNAQWFADRDKLSSDFEKLMEEMKSQQTEIASGLKETDKAASKVSAGLETVFRA